MTTTIQDTAPSQSPKDVPLRAWHRLARVVQKIEQIGSRGLRCSDLSLAHFDVLMHVGTSEGITQQELADSLLVTKGNVCQLLGRMEEAGLIRRQQEGRTNRLYLTNQGRAQYHCAGPAHEARIAQCFESLTEADQRELLRLLQQLDRALDANSRTLVGSIQEDAAQSHADGASTFSDRF